MEQSGTDTSKPDLIITLVHGTWPRGLPLLPKPWPDKRPLWFEEGSGFRSHLEAMLSAEGLRFSIRSHRWSGANSVYERSNAAQRLGHTLKTTLAEYPDATQVVIGHSHGGNVALLSLKELPDNHDEIHVVTLATPFLEILPLSISEQLKKKSRLALTFAQVGIGGYISRWVNPYLVFDWQHFLITIFLSVVPFCLFLIPLLVLIYMEAPRLQLLVASSPQVRPASLLVLRAVDDEASLALAAAALTSRISALVMAIAGRIVSFSALGVSIATILWAYAFMTGYIFASHLYPEYPSQKR